MPNEPPEWIYLQWYGDQEPENCNGEPGEVTWSRDAVFRHDIEYRRVSGPSPEVLMRAMRLMHFALYDENLHVPMAGDPQNYIRQAEAEIAAETKGGAK